MTRLAQLLLVLLFLGAGAAPASCAVETPPARLRAGTTDLQPSSERPVGWRGDGTGRYPAARPPIQWSASEHVRWQVEVGAGQSSPIVVGQRVLITVEPDLLICLDADSGKELWRKAHRFSDLPGALNVKDPGQSSQYGDITPTPVSDGKHIWVFVGTGLVACYDLDGTRRWINGFDLPLTTMYGRTASPVLVGERLLVHFGPLVCLDAATGKLLWKSDNAKATYGTPARARIGDTDVVITPKGDVVRVGDGMILASGLGNCMYASPVVQGNVVYFMESEITAVRLPDRAADQVRCQELWSGSLAGEFYASPLIDGGRIYTVDKAANYYVLDANTGKTILNKTLEFTRTDGVNVYPSPCLAGKVLFIGNDVGEILIVDPNNPVVVLGANSLPRGSGATSTFSGQRMFIRGGKLLYCVGAP